MKILRNKTYRGMVDEIKDLERLLNGERIANGKLKNEVKELEEEKNACVRRLDNLQAGYKGNVGQMRENIKKLEEEKHSLLGAKGGYVKEINKLKKKIEELEEKLKESMTDKYLVKKLPSGRRPKGQTMKITSHAVVSKITRQMHDNE